MNIKKLILNLIRNRYTHKVSELVENILLERYSKEPNYPPLFILGLPRSGTTLLYQYLVYRLHVSYFMNGTDQWPKAAALNTYIRYRKFGEYKSGFQNSYGYIQGNNSPHEAGSFWGQFFGYHDYFDYSELTLSESIRIKRTISAIEHIFNDKPFINKNVKHLLRLNAIVNLFPKAIFIVINRELTDVAISLLRGRYKNNASSSKWWSVRPANWRELGKLDPIEQITHQVINLNARLSEDLNTLQISRLINISYDEFCEHPEGIIQTINSKFSVGTKQTEPISNFVQSFNMPANSEEERLISLMKKFS